MKKSLFLLFFTPAFACAQNLPACDSLIINCCTFDTSGAGSVTILVSNYSSVLFDYPGFVLIDSTLDTIAVETVHYFGIGQGPQPHTMEIVSPLLLPFYGTLNLYTGFGTALACSFPFSIPATAIGEPGWRNFMTIAPNPSNDFITVTVKDPWHEEYSYTLFDFTGRKIMEGAMPVSPARISVEGLNGGLYFIRISDRLNKISGMESLLIQR